MTKREYHLGRRYSLDDRDQNYPMRAVALPVFPAINSRYWTLGTKLDQGRTSECVGHAARQLLTTSPHRFKAVHPDQHEIYHLAQQNDEWPGENYEGTSARGAMKALAAQGVIASYHWSNTVEEAAQFLLGTGPVLVGANWHNDMFTPDAHGFIKPTGGIAGGHEFLWYGYNHKTWTCSFCNSWGTGWGLKGTFKMDRSDFETLMADQGDMVAALEA